MRLLNLTGRNLKEGFRDPIVVILSVAQPVFYLILFNLIAKSDPTAPVIFDLAYFIPGIILFCFGLLTLFMALLLARDRQRAFLTRLLVSPLRTTDFVLGYLLALIPFALFQVAACLITGFILGLDLHWGILFSLVVFIPLAVSCTALGIVAGSLFSENAAPAIGSLFVVVITFLGGVWMDLGVLGGLFERIAYLLPFAHAVDAGRLLFQGASPGEIGAQLAWVYGYGILFIFLGVVAFRWKTRP